MDEGRKSQRCHLPGYLRDHDRATELIGRIAPDEDAANIGQRGIDDDPRFLHAKPDGRKRADRLRALLVLCHRAADAQNADALDVAEIILSFLDLRDSLERKTLSGPIDEDFQR